MSFDIILVEKFDYLWLIIGLLDHFDSLFTLNKGSNSDQLVKSHHFWVDVFDDFWFDVHLSILKSSFIMEMFKKFDSFF